MAQDANELISCFRVVHGSCAIPLTGVEEKIATAQLLYVCSAIESMLATWNDYDGCERAAAKLVDPYKALVLCQQSADPERERSRDLGGWHGRRSRPW